jgi:hypothetical protein
VTKLHELAPEWREAANVIQPEGTGIGAGNDANWARAYALRTCADELAAALAEPSEQEVERAAERVWHEMPLFSEPGDRWETAQSWVKERCRIIARAALQAARRRA